MLAYNIWPKFRVIVLNREERTTGLRPLPIVKGLVWFTAQSKTQEGNEAEVHGRSFGRRLSISIGRYTTVFQDDIYAIFTYVYEIQTIARSDKYTSICYFSQAALRTLRPANTTPHLNDNTKGRWMALLLTTPCHLGLFDSPDILVLSGKETSIEFVRERFLHQCAGQELIFEVPRHNFRHRINCWLFNQRITLWQGLTRTQRQLEIWCRGLASLLRLGYLPSVRYNPGWQLAF